eukprot:CAMPEP_0114518660 /NCGR_PEP_ID=MMETSP0109-20121206/18565_1 /TAXON_ID=29199 /ORGANISM="Chlorarachnion reptans, Strain CCCM449" /LENGTH=345 /DNA_ID=CAMNT_0001699301 /DNA_START=212 /DNA_END=1249 /DNA_ORIENTATION=+
MKDAGRKQHPEPVGMRDLSAGSKGQGGKKDVQYAKSQQKAEASVAGIGFWFVVWYGSSVLCNNSSKELLPLVGSGRVLTLMQLIASSILGLTVLSCGVGGLKLKKCSGYQRQIWILGAIFATSFLCLNVGMQYMHVSMAMVLRATEPLFAVVIIVVRGGTVKLSICATLVMVVLGAAMCAFSEPKFSMTGLALLGLANFGFTMRSVTAKAIKDENSDVDNVNLFFHCCWRGAIFQAVVVSCFDLNLATLLSGHFGDDPRFFYLAAVNSIGYFMYLQASFIVLSKVGVVSHTVGNSLRRPVCIALAVAYFGNKITSVQLLGIILACVGAGAYSVLKASSSATPGKK